jgi:cell pole-organizing protein PopZ
MTGSQDQSMEEILQSIKRIIAEESDEDAQVEPVNSTNALHNDVKGSDVLELTDAVEEDEEEPLELDDIVEDEFAPEEITSEVIDEDFTAAFAEEEQHVSEEEHFAAMIDIIDESERHDVIEAIDAVVPEAMTADNLTEDLDDDFAEQERTAIQDDVPLMMESLISEEVAKTTANSFHKIVEAKHKPATAKVPTQDDLPFRSGTTVEDLTIELLKPIMKQWLDTNLPPIVERLVAQEIRRLADSE